MKIALLARTTSYSNQRIIDTAIKRGHSAELIVYTECQPSSVNEKPDVIYHGRSLADFDAIIPRVMSGSPIDGVTTLKAFEAIGTFSTTSSNGIELSHDKAAASHKLQSAGVPIPQTLDLNNKDDLAFPFVIKALTGTQGDGVWLVKNMAELDSLVGELKSLKRAFYAQEFIEESAGSDIRIFVIDGEVAGAIKRQAKEGEFRSNVYLGGNADAIEATAKEEELAVKACDAMGLKIGGVDILRSKRGPLVIEVNSSPGFKALESATGIDVAAKIVEFVEHSFHG
ncbi:MAG: ribosomal protein modification protein [Candidatus Saccharibacteria bacterium]|nr:ribosomal protein modification protein [Candidatus Saccharibacteria bacterium]